MKKGIFVNIIRRCDGVFEEGGDVLLTAATINQHFDIACIKVTENDYNYNVWQGRDLALELALALDPTVEVWGFAAVHPHVNISRQVEVIVERVKQLGLTHMLIDAEMAWEVPINEPRYDSLAAQLMQGVQRGLDDYGCEVGVTTFRYPSLHFTFPFAAFHDEADFTMPQIYWLLSHDPVDQLDQTLTEYADPKWGMVGVPVMAAGPAYPHQGWQPSPSEILAFWGACQERGVDTVLWWDYAHAKKMPEVWQELITLPYPPVEPEPEEHEHQSYIDTFILMDARLLELEEEDKLTHARLFSLEQHDHFHPHSLATKDEVAALRLEYDLHYHLDDTPLDQETTFWQRLRWLFTGRTVV